MFGSIYYWIHILFFLFIFLVHLFYYRQINVVENVNVANNQMFFNNEEKQTSDQNVGANFCR